MSVPEPFSVVLWGGLAHMPIPGLRVGIGVGAFPQMDIRLLLQR